MHLKSISMKGFKSFPERTRLLFAPGVSVVVGPNGSGKSNITDAVLWALGEQSPLAVRGQSMQDVIFSGGHGRSQRNAAEVEVVIDNSDGRADSQFAELSIVRRLDRSGDGEYRLNGARCRLIDIIEVLSDTGLGKEMHSVVSQGRVEEIIHSKPRDRRLLVEEAAGLGKHRKRRRRAQLKLDRTQDNLDRALDVEREARSRLRPLKRQAEAADLHERINRQADELRLRLVADELRGIEVELSRAEKAALAARKERDEVDAGLAEVARRREAAERRFAERDRERQAFAYRLVAFQVAQERLAVRGDALAARVVRLEAGLENRRRALEAMPQAEQGAARLLSAALRPKPGMEAALAAALAERLDAEVAESLASAARRLDGAGPEGARLLLRSGPPPGLPPAPPSPGARRLLDCVEVDPALAGVVERLLRNAWLVKDLQSVPPGFQGLAVTAAGRAFDARVGELRRPAAAAVENLRASPAAPALADRVEAVAEVLAQLRRAAEAATEARVSVQRRAEGLERQGADDEAAGEHTAAELRACSQEEYELQARLRNAAEAVTQAEVAAAHLRDRQAETAGELERICARLGLESHPATEPLPDADREDLERKIERLGRRREQLGPVNPLAQSEYEEARAHVDALEEQRRDMEAALGELKGLIRETDRRIRESFERTFDATAANFGELIEHLFPGGRGRLRLVSPEGPRAVLGGSAPGESSGDSAGAGLWSADSEGRTRDRPAEGSPEAGFDELAEAEESPPDEAPGIEVEVTPAGKATKRLSLLSGGEKSLVALAFMFAVFLARPCPFYILDEVEAALDDANIDRFLQLIRRYSDRAQFIVVTHQKRTMDAADVLYGVTMGDDGVTKVVSRRLPRDEEAGEDSRAVEADERAA